MNNKSFPLRIVGQFNKDNTTWRGRRGIGAVVARGMYRFGCNACEEMQVSVVDDADRRVAITAQVCQSSLQLMFSRFTIDPAFGGLLKKLAECELAVVFIEGHERLLELDSDANILTVACDLAIPLGYSACLDFAQKTADQQAFEHLLALGHYYLLLCWQGWTERQALAKVVEGYASLLKTERACLHSLLEGNLLDSGNLFSMFLKRAAFDRTGGIEISRQQVWLDQQMTWLFGQDRIDLPYPRQAALDILQGEADVDGQRTQLYQLLRGYDRSLESGNIERIATEVRAARQQLIFGRMSRAFHNQATLFANAVLLQPGAAWRQLAAELSSQTVGVPELHASAGALALLLASSGEIPLTTLEGACERFEDAVLDEQKKALSDALVDSRSRVENYNDPLVGQYEVAAPHADIMVRAGQGLRLVDRIREEFLGAAKRHAAYVVISQRPSPTGSHLLIKINEFQDPYSGKAENLRKLVRLAGDRIYSSPDYGWLAVADHWIEAIPLFIKEEVLVQDGQESTRTVIDISGMEVSFREEMADLWAVNLRQVLDSELHCLAREYVAGEKLTGFDEVSDADDIAAVAVLLGDRYRREINQVQKLIEAEELAPFDAMRQILLGDPILRQLAEHQQGTGSWPASVRQLIQVINFDTEVFRLKPHALKPRRALPTLHVLTTQSAGMTEGYIRTWLEESMALFNIAEDLGLHDKITEREAFFISRILALGEKLIRELGVWIEVEELCANEQIPQTAAILRLINRNRLLQQELSCLGALLEFEEIQQGRKKAEDCGEPKVVEDYLTLHAEALQEAALIEVIARNRTTLISRMGGGGSDEALRRTVLDDEYYRQDLEAYTRLVARRRVLEGLNAGHPQQQLNECCETYLRRFQQLRKTTARKEIIAEHGLNHLTLSPQYYFQASGGGKRYHLIYTPSRVDLGQRERESVETWSQWVGGADRAAAQTGRQIYSLINKDVRCFDSLTEPEILKTGENASMASHFGFSNALSMMVTASAHGDFEAMADLMNRRRDRLIHPAGEGYGGYCVPKDGLFLEFVLTLNCAEKLSQMGLPAAYHSAVVALANALLDRKPEFGGQLEWEAWAASQLQGQDGLKPYFTVSSGLPVFQITRIAHVLEHLGKPQLRDPYRVAASLAAGWGLHKMVTGGEQVNRFMPFFKSWLIRQGVCEAARRHADLPIRVENCVVVLTAEYKPDTQDARFATGLRKFEILAGTGSHLLNALDLDGRIIAVLMNEGFEGLQQRGWDGRIRDMLAISADDSKADGQLRGLFPASRLPAEIRMVSPTGLSTQDLLNYTSDTQLEAIADETHRELLALGLTAKEIEANLRTWGARLGHWASRQPPSTGLLERMGGRIHVLALAVLGPERRYEYAVQGADVIDTGIPHRSLRDLLADPARLCRLMLEGNPNSALVIVDGAAGARHRAMNRGDVMRWFAAAEQLGRESVYLSVGMGQQTIEAWRSDMRRRRRRAERLLQSLTGDDPGLAHQVYGRIIDEIRQDQEIQSALSETDKLDRFGRGCESDRVLVDALGRIGSGVALKDLGFVDFLALGGLYLLMGATEEDVRAAMASFATAITRLGGYSSRTDERVLGLLLPTHQRMSVAEFREEKGVESSNKAMEERATVALETRRQLAARVAQARALNQRQTGFAAVLDDTGDFISLYRKAIAVLGNGGQPVTEEHFGAFLKYTHNALTALARDFQSVVHPEETQGMLARLEQLFSGRQLDEQIYHRIAGGYEDIGDFGRLAQQISEQAQQGKIDAVAKEQGLRCVAQGAELFYILLAVETTIAYTHQEPSTFDAMSLWRALSGFFAKTLNDHSYEYRPWVYSRGTGYADYQGERLYRFAVERHQWLYGYLRHVVTHYTDLRELTGPEQDMLLGNYLDGMEIEAIGAGADGQVEKIWRAYGQLRELAFIRNDGFAIPVVFAEFDPDLIHDRARVNHVIAVPVGRTHFSRVLCEGPSLARQLEQEGRRGGNLIITRNIGIMAKPDGQRPVALITSGHFYLDAASYAEALVRYKGCSRPEAARLSASVAPKGIRVAAHFTRPVLAALVYPFHGDPVYDQGKLEACGLPYTVQSLFHTWTTYDKAKYRDIFRGSGVDMPDEIDWLTDDTARSQEKAVVKNWISNGLPESAYPGLRAFAQCHPLVMIKDAAESGGRNAGAFLLVRPDGSLDSEQMESAVDFIYQISLKHHVCIQEVILSSPEHWATEAFMQAFVHRQIVEWGSAVNRQRQPYTPIFGSHRIILSTDKPGGTTGSTEWHISHWITLNSKQLITNVGRGGTLEQLLPETIRPEHRDAILGKLAEAGRRVMEAMARYEAHSASLYTAETGRTVGADLMGVSYGMPRYLMLDFLIAPVFGQDGVLVEIEPIFDDNGCRIGSRFILQHGSRRFPGNIVDWHIVLIEPNIGVGLWDRVALREEYHELERARSAGVSPDWERIGENARVVLSDLNRAGEDYLNALNADHVLLS
ncbi:MAG: hypothetical protein Q7U57_01695 [Methylovulum sp.]|nr:hypothetical protein [Methylovulum sp.]